jgi:hypothetical protein
MTVSEGKESTPYITGTSDERPTGRSPPRAGSLGWQDDEGIRENPVKASDYFRESAIFFAVSTAATASSAAALIASINFGIRGTAARRSRRDARSNG